MSVGPANFDSFDDARAYYESLSYDDLVAQAIAKDALLRAALRRHQEAERDSDHDELTGLLNRRGLRKEYEYKRKQRRATDAAKPDLIALIDLDDFKRINDSKGHDAGDDTLVQIAKLLKLSLRGGDVVGRHGGDEFVSLLFDTTLEEGRQVAERMRSHALASASAEAPVTIPTLSIGLATIDYSLPYDKSLKAADTAMYSAKQSGKNAVYLLEPTVIQLPD